MIYYISDLHIGDQRIFNLCKRPFLSLSDYEVALIKKWNSKVSDEDTVYVLGDISNGDVKHTKDFFEKLNGNKHLIVGNHDEEYYEEYLKEGIVLSAVHAKYIEDNKRLVFLCHYPVMDWKYGNKTIHHIYGHIHNKTINDDFLYEEIKQFYKNKLAFNASVDVTGFEPVTLDELISLKEDK